MEELFDSIVVIENYPLDRGLIRDNKEGTGGLTVESWRMNEQQTHYNLTAAITLSPTVEIALQAAPGKTDNETLQRMVQHFGNILREITVNPMQSSGSINFLTESEPNEFTLPFQRRNSGIS